MQTTRMRRMQAGVTLLELMIGLAVVGVLIAMAIPSMSQMGARQRARDAARLVSSVLTLARSEAIRTGNVQIVFYQIDAQNNPLVDGAGNPATLLILDDGPPGSLGQNCRIDAGEPTSGFAMPPGVAPGVLGGAGLAPTDLGGGAMVGGVTFTDPGNNPSNWVLFRPEGMPVAFDAACGTDVTGSGAGAIYLNGGNRTYAAVLMPLGGTRVHAWNEESAQWSD